MIRQAPDRQAATRMESLESRLLLTGTFSADLTGISYQDSAGREIAYDFSSPVVTTDGDVQIPDAAVTGRSAGESSTTFLWEPQAGLAADATDGAFQMAIPQAAGQVAFIPTATVKVDGLTADWAAVGVYCADGLGDASGSAPAGADIDYVKLAYSSDGSRLNILIHLDAAANPDVTYQLVVDNVLSKDGTAVFGDFEVDIGNSGGAWGVSANGWHLDGTSYSLADDGLKGLVVAGGGFIEASVSAAALGLPGTANITGQTLQAGGSDVYDPFSNPYREFQAGSTLGADGATDPAVDNWGFGARLTNFQGATTSGIFNGVDVGSADSGPDAAEVLATAGWFSGTYNGTTYTHALILTASVQVKTSGDTYEWSTSVNSGDAVILDGHDPATTTLDLAVVVDSSGQHAQFMYRIDSSLDLSDQTDWTVYAEETLPGGTGTMTGFPDSAPTVALESSVPSSSPNLADTTWEIASEHGRGSVTFDDQGQFVSGSFTDSSGLTQTFASVSYQFDPSGRVNLHIVMDDPLIPDAVLIGTIDPGGNVMFTGSSERPLAQGDADEVVLVKHSGAFVNADLAGAWYFNRANGSGVLSFDALQHVVGGTFSGVDGTKATITGGTYTLQADGLLDMTITINDPNSPTSTFTGAMSDSKDLLVLTDNPLSDTDGSGLNVATRKATGLGAGDLSGRWGIVDIGVVGWAVLNGAGKVLGGSMERDGGDIGTVLGGTYSISADGKVSMTMTTSDPQSGPVKVIGSMNAGRTLVALGDATKHEWSADNATQALPANGFGADLTGEFASSTLPATLVPGDKGVVKVTVRNLGQLRALGTATLRLYASADGAVDAGDSLLGTLDNQAINLAYRAGKSYSFTVEVGSHATPGTYNLLLEIVPSAGVHDTIAADDVVVGGAYPLVWQFGKVGSRTNVKLPLKDSDGTAVTFSLSGLGTGTVTSDANGFGVSLTGTTTASSVTVATTKSKTPGDDGKAVLTGVNVSGAAPSGSLKSFAAATCDLAGNVTVAGTLGGLTLANATGGQKTITVSGAGLLAAATTYTFNEVAELDILSLTLPIKSITAIRWLDNAGTPDAIQTTSLGSLSMKGKTGVAGDFMADLGLSDASATLAATNLTVAGQLKESTIRAAGSLGNVNLGAMIDSKLLAGMSGTVNVLDDITSALFTSHAATIKALTIKGFTGAPADLVSNSLVAAWNLGTVNLWNVKTNNGGTPFGVAAHKLTSYTRKAGTAVADKASNRSGPLDPALDPVVVESVLNFAVKLYGGV